MLRHDIVQKFSLRNILKKATVDLYLSTGLWTLSTTMVFQRDLRKIKGRTRVYSFSQSPSSSH